MLKSPMTTLLCLQCIYTSYIHLYIHHEDLIPSKPIPPKPNEMKLFLHSRSTRRNHLLYSYVSNLSLMWARLAQIKLHCDVMQLGSLESDYYLIKVLFGCMCIHFNSHELEWIGMKLNLISL